MWNKKTLLNMWQNRETIALFLLKTLLLMIPISIFIRMCVICLFNFNDDILSVILLVLLCLPFIYYFLNIIIKYLKKSNVKE